MYKLVGYIVKQLPKKKAVSKNFHEVSSTLKEESCNILLNYLRSLFLSQNRIELTVIWFKVATNDHLTVEP